MGDFNAPVYFTTGNHEYYVDTKKVLQRVKEAGIRLLDNEKVDTHGLQLVGLRYMNADENSYDPHRVNDLTI